MKKFLPFVLIIVTILIAGFFYYKDLIDKEEISSKITMSEESLKEKKVAMVIAFRDFRDEEYFVPKEILEKNGVKIQTVSNKKGLAIGADGGEVEVDLLVSEANPHNFDAVVFIGGPGCLDNLDNEDSYRLARETIAQSKILSAICISPVILAKAGVLQGKKVTVWSSPMDKEPIRILEEKKAVYQEGLVVVDGNIITANGPGAAEEFAKTILEALTGEQ